jgi:hypothetical protein
MERRGRGRRIVAALLLAAMIGMASARPVAADDENRFATDFGYGVGAFFTNLLYMPTKFTYATLGAITGGFAYVLTGFNYNVGKSVWVPSTGGDYVITPAMLRGDDPIYFSGVTQPKHESRAREEEDLPADSGAGAKSY